MAIEKVNISVSDDYLDRFAEVVQRVQRAGLKVERQLQDIGVVTGSIDSAKVADLDRVQGVAAVERARGVHLPPPESDVQ